MTNMKNYTEQELKGMTNADLKKIGGTGRVKADMVESILSQQKASTPKATPKAKPKASKPAATPKAKQPKAKQPEARPAAKPPSNSGAPTV